MKFNLAKNLAIIRKESPLVHNITNFVVMNYTANALLAIGASPVMAHAIEEVEDMAAIAGALVINIGTLSPPWVEGMKKAIRAATKLGKPVILDPVGAGATSYRNEVLSELLAVASPTLIRGNGSEILALAGASIQTKGVDSTTISTDSIQAARLLSERYGCVVSVSGATDVIVSGNKVAYVKNGVPLMTRVTGMGCSASAIAAAFCAIQQDAFDAAVSAAVLMGVCGEKALEKAASPGSFQIAFLDALAEITSEMLERMARVE
jgi:hydroxyethylthiazole kinase